MTVTAFIQYLNETFRAIWDAEQVALEGEVTGYRLSGGQWMNFDLKDDQSLVSIFLPAAKCRLPIQDGMRVRIYGWPRIYPKYGKFSFSADRIELVGEGALQKALALLRQKFEAEGLFDPSRKRTLVRFPKRIALIASRESAAYGDFIRILNERWAGLEIDLYHVLVQGERAPPDIIKAFKRAQKRHLETPYDAVVMTRGGGSLEELMSFNDEGVVRAVFGCKIPTMVAIGHERDLTFAEEVADIRGSTPTDCARRLVPDKADILYELAQHEEGITSALESALARYIDRIDRVVLHAEHWMDQLVARAINLVDRIDRDLIVWFARWQDRLTTLSRLLESYNPTAVLKRGYALVYDRHDRACPESAMLESGANVTIQWRDGKRRATLDGSSQEQATLL